MKIAIIGASGFVGQHLTMQLLDMTDYELVLFSHKATRLQYPPNQEKRITHIDGSVLAPAEIEDALSGCGMAVYLVHLMGGTTQHEGFDSLETQAADNFAAAVRQHHLKRVVYVGGMGTDDNRLTKHLRSRASTGSILRSKIPQLIELRTPMIIGPGGAGFEVLTMMVRRLPVFPVPKWALATTNPITIRDVVRYIMASLELKEQSHLTIDIGGPERLSYVDIARRYAKSIRKRFIVVPIPLVTTSFAKLILRQLRGIPHVQTVADMIDSAGYSTPELHARTSRLFPAIIPESIDAAFGAMERTKRNGS